MTLQSDMDEKINTEEARIVSWFHEKADTAGHMPQELMQTGLFRETEKIWQLRGHVGFLSRLSPENQLWRKIKNRIRPAALSLYWKVAAFFILSFSLGALLVYFTGMNVRGTEMASISSPRGQITSLTLFDGSVVWLNSESTIEYSSAFNTGIREVFLKGEAYFEVAPGKAKPFIVNLQNSQIKVHGTRFNVRAYPESNEIEAVLSEGEIEFVSGSGSVTLKPDEGVVLSLSRGTLVKHHVDVEKALAWKKGKYYYNKEKLPVILNQLQRWYDVEIMFNEAGLEAYTFTGVIDHNKSIRYNLRLLELTNRIKVIYENEKIIIQGN